MVDSLTFCQHGSTAFITTLTTSTITVTGVVTTTVTAPPDTTS